MENFKMIKRIGWLIVAAGLSSISSLVFAYNPFGPVIYATQSGYFLGLGGSYNFVKTNVRSSGELEAVSGAPPLGEFPGTAISYEHTKNVVAPMVQLGYFHTINCTYWVSGIKLLYQYLNSENSRNMDMIYENPDISDTVTATVKTRITHEAAAIVFLGYSLRNSSVYLGIGPGAFKTINSVTNLNDVSSALYIGNLDNLSTDSKWVWAPMAQAGLTVNLTPTWFLDFNYTFAQSQRYKSNNSEAYTLANGGLNNGTISLDTSKRIIEQAITLSINKIFY